LRLWKSQDGQRDRRMWEEKGAVPLPIELTLGSSQARPRIPSATLQVAGIRGL